MYSVLQDNDKVVGSQQANLSQVITDKLDTVFTRSPQFSVQSEGAGMSLTTRLGGHKKLFLWNTHSMTPNMSKNLAFVRPSINHVNNENSSVNKSHSSQYVNKQPEKNNLSPYMSDETFCYESSEMENSYGELRGISIDNIRTPVSSQSSSYSEHWKNSSNKKVNKENSNKIYNYFPEKKNKTPASQKVISKMSSSSAEKKLKQSTLSFAKLVDLYSPLTEMDCHSIIKDIDQHTVNEMLLTIQYQEGFCQLNKPIEYNKTDYCTPAGIMLMVSTDTCTVKYYYLSLKDLTPEGPKDTFRHFFDKVLSSECHIICYGAQEMIAFLIDVFKYSERQVCLHWMLLDPCVGCWLLDPDNPPNTFSDLIGNFSIPMNIEKYDNLLNHTCQLLKLLSISSEKVFVQLLINKLTAVFIEMEMKLVPILAVLELHGICVNKAVFEDMNNEIEESMTCLQLAANKAAGKPVNLNSPTKLRLLLFEELKLDEKNNIRIRETAVMKAKSTSESVLKLLEPYHPLPSIILRYRHLQKIKSTYIEGMLQHVKQDSYIFTTWDQVSTATGRLASCNPNLQSVPKVHIGLESQPGSGVFDSALALRSPFIPRPGYTFLAADYQHIEFRVCAHLAQDQSLLQIFQQTDGDIFLTLAETWLKNSNSEITAVDRDKTKRTVYAVMYGAGASKLAEVLQVTEEEASKIMDNFLATFPSLRTFFNFTVAKCRRSQELRTLGGRRRLFRNIRSTNNFLKAQAERQAINFVIQGSAADICKAAMIRVEEELARREDLDTHLVLQIHDELMWEVRESHVEKVKEIVKQTMEDNSTICSVKIQFSVPLPVVIKTGINWDKLT